MGSVELRSSGRESTLTPVPLRAGPGTEPADADTGGDRVGIRCDGTVLTLVQISVARLSPDPDETVVSVLTPYSASTSSALVASSRTVPAR
jgi:hypothetical protein